MAQQPGAGGGRAPAAAPPPAGADRTHTLSQDVVLRRAASFSAISERGAGGASRPPLGRRPHSAVRANSLSSPRRKVPSGAPVDGGVRMRAKAALGGGQPSHLGWDSGAPRAWALQREVQALASRLLAQRGDPTSLTDLARAASKGSCFTPVTASAAGRRGRRTSKAEPASRMTRSWAAPSVDSARDAPPGSGSAADVTTSAASSVHGAVRVRREPEPRCWTIVDQERAADTITGGGASAVHMGSTVHDDALAAPSLAAEISLRALSTSNRPHSARNGRSAHARAEASVAVVDAPMPAAAAKRHAWPPATLQTSGDMPAGAGGLPLQGQAMVDGPGGVSRRQSTPIALIHALVLFSAKG